MSVPMTLEPALAPLRAHTDPLVRARAIRLGPGGDDAESRDELLEAGAELPTVQRMLSMQRRDGSFGGGLVAKRVVPTLVAVRSLVDVGFTHRLPAVAAGLDVLHGAIVDGGFGAYGDRGSVASCYTGMAAEVFLRAGRVEAAAPLLRWIVRHQEVRHHGLELLTEPRAPFAPHLRTRWGGCLGDTTCLLGLVWDARALLIARRAGLDVGGGPQLDAVREILTRRRVCENGAGEVLPLAGRSSRDPAGTRWTAPAIPLTHLFDLPFLCLVAAEVGVPQDSLAPALSRVAAWRLPDGGWPLTGHRNVEAGYRPERRSADRRSAWATLRVLEVAATSPAAASVLLG